MNRYNLIFDLDGTLVDSSVGIYCAFCEASNTLGLVPPDLHHFRSYIGPPIALLAKEIYTGISSSDLCLLESAYRHHYDLNYYSHYSLYPHALSTISSLHCRDSYTLSIVTNKPTDVSIAILQLSGLLHMFDLVLGVDYFCRSSSSTSHTKSSLIRHVSSLKPGYEPIYIGDRYSDLASSNAANVRFVAALYGYQDWEFLEKPAQSIADLPALLPLLNNL